jgi:Protein of unknown function (DUF3455)
MRNKKLGFISAAAGFALTFSTQAQNSTDPPAAQHASLTVIGKGVQIYACQYLADAPQWVFQAPEAALFDVAGAKVGTHGAGPVWTYQDGSLVKGEVVAKNPAPEAGAVPWLLLKAAGVEGSGLLTRIEFIRRSDTHGGIAPPTGCDARHLGAISRVPYMAVYTFYSSKL